MLCVGEQQPLDELHYMQMFMILLVSIVFAVYSAQLYRIGFACRISSLSRLAKYVSIVHEWKHVQPNLYIYRVSF